MLREYELKIEASPLSGMRRFNAEKAYIHEKRNLLENCPYCGSCIRDRKVALYRGIISSLYQVYIWCGKNSKHEFQTKEIKHLLGKNEYSRFGDLVRFGGLVYKPKRYGKAQKALYGLNMARAKEFFAGRYDIPVQITLDQITGEILSDVRVKVWDFPELSTYLKQNGMYDYELPVQKALL